jgi:hypothetical protein
MRTLPLFLALTACASSSGPPDFALEDVNPGSPSYGERVGPADHAGAVSAWYFGWADCAVCQSHVDHLDTLPDRVGETAVPVTVLGINAAGRESGNAAMTEGHTLAWLQDTPEDDVWGRWAPRTVRELVIVGPDGTTHDRWDLNVHDPADEAVREDLIQALRDAAEG